MSGAKLHTQIAIPGSHAVMPCALDRVHGEKACTPARTPSTRAPCRITANPSLPVPSTRMTTLFHMRHYLFACPDTASDLACASCQVPVEQGCAAGNVRRRDNQHHHAEMSLETGDCMAGEGRTAGPWRAAWRARRPAAAPARTGRCARRAPRITNSAIARCGHGGLPAPAAGSSLSDRLHPQTHAGEHLALSTTHR